MGFYEWYRASLGTHPLTVQLYIYTSHLNLFGRELPVLPEHII